MPPSSTQVNSSPLARLSPLAQWLALAGLSLALVLLLELVHLPAALLLGSLLAAIAFSTAGGSLHLPGWLFLPAQGVVGCMIAKNFPSSILGAICQNWVLFLSCTLAVIGASTLLGWLLARWRVLPGTTAIWGSSPGAATAMTLIAESHGADVRLVALMQYLRVILVAAVASAIARFWIGAAGGQVQPIVWFPPILWSRLALSLALIGLSLLLARLLHLRSGALLLPLLLGALLQHVGGLTLQLPPWLLAASYALIGWSIGLRFSRPILLYAARTLPHLTLSILALIAVCGAFAFILTRAAGIDPLTAYLATSPGGADSVAIIAASTKVDMPFVMAMQTIRFLTVLLLGPRLAQFLASRMAPAKIAP